MSQVDGASEQDSGRRGMDRRTMIKAAAAAGVGAWTAPMIIDSLSSPAAAGSVAGNCTVVAFKATRANGEASCNLALTACGSTTKSGATLCTAYTGAPHFALVLPTSSTSGSGACGPAMFSVTGTNCGFAGIFVGPAVANPTVCPASVVFTPLANTTTASATYFIANNQSAYIFLAVNCSP